MPFLIKKRDILHRKVLKDMKKQEPKTFDDLSSCNTEMTYIAKTMSIKNWIPLPGLDKKKRVFMFGGRDGR